MGDVIEWSPTEPINTLSSLTGSLYNYMSDSYRTAFQKDMNNLKKLGQGVKDIVEYARKKA